jgi:transposase
MSEITWTGLDVHASSVFVALLSGQSNDVETMEIQNDPQLIRRKFRKLAKGRELCCCYEAGPCGYELYRLFQDLGIYCEIVAPSLIPRRPGDRIKTDRRDAIQLARLSRSGDLTFIRVPDRAQESARDVLRARDDVRKVRMAARHRLTKFLLRRGRRYTDGTNWTQKFWQWIARQTFEFDTDRLVFDSYIDHVRYLDTRLDALDASIVDLAQTEPFRGTVDLLMCLRGISVLSAMVIVTELYDLRRFSSPRELMAFVGLVPSEHSSGPKTCRGGITKTGNAHVRRILVESAWAYARRQSSRSRQVKQLVNQPPEVGDIVRTANQRLGSRFRRLVGRGKSKNVAATAIARELCGFIWALGTMERPAAA